MKSLRVLVVLLFICHAAFGKGDRREIVDSFLKPLAACKTEPCRQNIFGEFFIQYYSVEPPDSGQISETRQFAAQQLKQSADNAYWLGVQALCSYIEAEDSIAYLNALDECDAAATVALNGGHYALAGYIQQFKIGLFGRLKQKRLQLHAIDESIDLLLKANDTRLLGNLYFKKAMLFRGQKRFREAVRNFQLGIASSKPADSLDNATSYTFIAWCYLSLKDVANARKAANKARMALQSPYPEDPLLFYGMNAAVFFDEGAYDSAAYYNKVVLRRWAQIKASNEYNDVKGRYGLGNISRVYQLQTKISLKRGNYSEAKRYLDSARVYYNLSAERNILIQYLAVTASYLEAIGAYKLSMDTFKAMKLLQDSDVAEIAEKNVSDYEQEFQFSKREALHRAQLAAQQAETKAESRLRLITIIAALIVVSLLVILALLLLRNVKREKQNSASIAAEKERSEALLLNILPEEVAEELKVKGASEARQFQEVTVLFTDFKDFTAISERLSPKELIAELHACFTAFDEIMGRNGLEKIKTVGDAYMAVSGLPVTHADHAVRAVNAALEIRDFVAERRKSRMAGGNEAFQVRIGLNTGPVVAGIVGVKKFAYDIWGDTVNMAARMESSGAPGRINISETTFTLVKEQFHCEYRGKVMAKNKGEVDMYFVERKWY
ncbi:MAG: adenylate/guanylate cyclase domain-containing protein [Chitinophagales bacterium]